MLPLLLRVPSMPPLSPGQRVRLAIDSMDFLTLDIACRYVEVTEEVSITVVADEETEGMVS